MTDSTTDITAFSAPLPNGAEQPLSAYRGQVLLIVNTASKCGFTPQYAGLEKLHRDFAGQGFSVLGFPCNQFGNQEPGDAAEIASFCALTYGVDFPIFAKIEVNGPKTLKLFDWLKRCKPGLLGFRGIKWNFTKFLIGRDGQVLARFAPTHAPEKLRGAIEQALSAR